MQQNQPQDTQQQPSFIPAGWIGGFSTQPPEQPYPNSQLLSSLPFEGNMNNIPGINRMLRAKWPEFSWEVTKGDPATRMYQMFAPDISRLGYDNTGRVWSIICPQQGVYFPTLGVTLNVEVTVAGNRGWMNELASKEELFAADVKIRPTIWFSTDNVKGWFWQQLLTLNSKWSNKLPLSKEQGIRISTSNEEGTNDIIEVRMGEYPDYPFPARASHWDDYAWTVANLAVKIGGIDSTSDSYVNEFNSWVMELFNLGSGNLLQENNTLIWNLWAGSPELVNQEEWTHHANYWRRSIEVNHLPPEGEGTSITDINGNPFQISQASFDVKIFEFATWIAYQLL